MAKLSFSERLFFGMKNYLNAIVISSFFAITFSDCSIGLEGSVDFGGGGGCCMDFDFVGPGILLPDSAIKTPDSIRLYGHFKPYQPSVSGVASHNRKKINLKIVEYGFAVWSVPPLEDFPIERNIEWEFTYFEANPNTFIDTFINFKRTTPYKYKNGYSFEPYIIVNKDNKESRYAGKIWSSDCKCVIN